jgi:hypothetical protein
MSDDPIEAAIDGATPAEIAERRRSSCPVKPLGVRSDAGGTLYAYQKSNGSVIALEPRQHTRSDISSLFGGRTRWLDEEFPAEKNERGGWSLEFARNWLYRECERAGRFDVETDLRGPGVWRLDYAAARAPDDPVLVVHVGNKMWLPTPESAKRGFRRRPVWDNLGRIGNHVYVAAAPEMRPADKSATIAETAALLELLKSWNWARPNIDPQLLLGAVGAAMIVGALDWRPSVCITGDKATGKSTLQQDLIYGGLLSSVLLFLSDTTEPALRQLLKGAARPVALDEFEGRKDDNTRSEAIITLLRLASRRGGGRVARGGRAGSASLYAIETMLFLSAVNPPPMSPQDLDRVAMLELGPLPATGSGDRIGPKIEKMRMLGPYLRRRMIDGWDRFEKMLDQFSGALAGRGHGTRGCDQYGTLLACAWVLLRDGLAETADELAEWADHLNAAELAVTTDDLPDHERCKIKLLSSSSPDSWVAGHRRPIGELVRVAFGLSPPDKDPGRDAPTSLMMEDADRDLRRIGLRVYPRGPLNDNPLLAISNSHDSMMRLFADTHWKMGGWARALLRVPGAGRADGGVRFGEVSTRAVLIPLAALGFEEDRPA